MTVVEKLRERYSEISQELETSRLQTDIYVEENDGGIPAEAWERLTFCDGMMSGFLSAVLTIGDLALLREITMQVVEKDVDEVS